MLSLNEAQKSVKYSVTNFSTPDKEAPPWRLPGDLLSLPASDAVEQMASLNKTFFAIFNSLDDLRPDSSLRLHRSLGGA